jgi:hypothetical protein
MVYAEGVKLTSGRASANFRCALRMVYAEGVKLTSGRASASKPLNRISHTMRIAIPVIALAMIMAIAPVTLSSIAFMIGVNFPIYLAAQAALIIWRMSAPAKALAIR